MALIKLFKSNVIFFVITNIFFPFSAVIGKHLVDRFIPFLPMERHHVAKCVITEIAQKNSKIEINKEDVDAIVQELEFYPKNYFLYSATGCKTISAKVDFFMEQFEDLGDESV